MTSSRLMSFADRTGAHARRLAAFGCVTLLLAGCGGGGGSDGKKGDPGVPGEPATTDDDLSKFQDAPGIQLEVTGVSGGSLPAGGSSAFLAEPLDTDHFAPGDTLTVTFSIKQDDGAPWGLGEMDTGRILVSGPSFNYQRVLAEKSDLVAASVKVGEATYAYTFALPIPETYLAPLNDTASFGADDGELAGEPLLGGTYTVGIYTAWNYTVDGEDFRDAGNATFDFLLGTTPEIAPREVVLVENCNQCHVELQAHGGLRREPKLCLLCHTAGAEDRNTASVENGTPGVSIDFKVLIHKLHNGAHLPSVLGVATNEDGTRDYAATPAPYKIIGFNNSVIDFSDVRFPLWPNLTSNLPKDLGYSALTADQKTQEDGIRGGVTTCLKCHGDPDDDGPLAAPAQGELYKSQPGRFACGACHDDIDFTRPYDANGLVMPADPGACNSCHGAEGDALSVVDGHLHPLHDTDVGGGVVVDISAVGGGTGAGGNLQPGDSPQITFSVSNLAGDPLGMTALDASVSTLLGPTVNQQVVMPYTGTNNVSLSPYDFAGRLQGASTTNKGAMSKVIATGPAVAETLVVEFSSSTAFDVTGTVSGNLGSGTLPAATSTNPSGSSLAVLTLSSDAVAQTIAVVFSDDRQFSVTGSVTGDMGSGELPSALGGSTKFTSTDGTVAFNLAVGTTTPFAAGNTIHVAVFETGVPTLGAPASSLLFGIIVGRTAFTGAAPAPDRFYDEFVPDASEYTLTFPMELALEFLGDGNGSAGQELVAGNLPVYLGRQVLLEATALADATTLSADVEPFARYVDVASTAGYSTSSTTYVVLDSGGGVGAREYLQLGFVESATRMWFKSPVRYAHASGAAVARPTLTFRQEGAGNHYTLDAASGTVTSGTAFGSGNGIVMTYRTDGRFGYQRHFGDAPQLACQPPPNDSDTLGPDWGEWVGLPYQDGTYTIGLWFSQNLQLGLQNELQTYRSTSVSANAEFLYGATATELVPHEIISSSSNCAACHDDVQFHGGGRAGFEACVLCHSVAGAEDKGQYDIPTAIPSTGVTIDFRTMLHKIHMGAELTNASTYQVVGNQASISMYDEVEFPAFPGGTKHCSKCHGEDSGSWMEPANRDYADGQSPTVLEWTVVCSSCHDSDVALVHMEAQTAPSGAESCALCHGEGKDEAVELVHKTR
jgi:OmcA/MtrC family decaheme c-type cytochrome